MNQRHELVAGRRPDESDPRVAFLAGCRPGRPRAIDGTRSTPYCFALSASRTRFASSIVILSDSGGSSSRICCVCTTRLAAERLREKQQPHRRGHFRERVAEFLLISGEIRDTRDYDRGHGIRDWGLGTQRSAVSCRPAVRTPSPPVPSPLVPVPSLEQIIERTLRAVGRRGRSATLAGVLV